MKVAFSLPKRVVKRWSELFEFKSNTQECYIFEDSFHGSMSLSACLNECQVTLTIEALNSTVKEGRPWGTPGNGKGQQGALSNLEDPNRTFSLTPVLNERQSTISTVNVKPPSELTNCSFEQNKSIVDNEETDLSPGYASNAADALDVIHKDREKTISLVTKKIIECNKPEVENVNHCIVNKSKQDNLHTSGQLSQSTILSLELESENYLDISSKSVSIESQIHVSGKKKEKEDVYSDVGEYYICCICQKRFQRIYFSLFMRHIHNKHKTKGQLMKAITDAQKQKEIWRSAKKARRKLKSAAASSIDTSNEKTTCDFCGNLFAKNHIKRHRQTCGENPDHIVYFYCMCGFKSIDSKEAEEHKTECTKKNTSLCCEQCGKVFQSRGGLSAHRRIKHGIATNEAKPIHVYACETCGERFHVKGMLQRHQSKHSDVRAFTCETCGSSFKQLQHLRLHVNTVHKNLYRYHCDKCGHGVQKKQELRSHGCDRVRRRRNEDQNKINDSSNVQQEIETNYMVITTN